MYVIIEAKEIILNRIEVAQFLISFFSGIKAQQRLPQAPPAGTAIKPFLKLVLSLKRSLPVSIPLLTDLAALASAGSSGEAGIASSSGVLGKRIERRYIRLCRIQEELGRLTRKKTASGDTGSSAGKTGSEGKVWEDYVFSQIDFSRYRKMEEKEFDALFPEGLHDFDETFFKKNFNRGSKEIQSVIEGSYKKTGGQYMLQRETPLVLSVMRTLETSLETSPLFTATEVGSELKNIFAFLDGSAEKNELPPGAELLYPLLVLSLDNIHIRHDDGMTTKLFIAEKGDLSGTFRPGDKPWTLVLIPRN